jgi:hypothetical protein
MGLRPTQRDENTFCQQLLPMEAPPSPLSSRAKPRDLRFSGPLVEMFFDRSVPEFPATQHWTRPRMRLSLKERRIMFANATNFNRKSG